MATAHRNFGPDLIGDDNDVLFPPGCGTGAIERDYELYPEEMFQHPDEMDLIDESEWDARFEEQEKEQSSLEHLYLGPDMRSPAFVNLDQNGDGYCWSYSTAHSVMITRVRDHAPNPRLNPHGPAAIIKNGRNEGGWCGLSQDFYRKYGCPVEGTGPGEWPLHSRDLRHNTEACRRAMEPNRCVEDWVDLRSQVYDRTLTTRQLATCLFRNQPCPIDIRKWGHSICAIRWVRVERGLWLPLILNSWKGWGRYGLAVLSKDMFDTLMGAVSVRTSIAA